MLHSLRTRIAPSLFSLGRSITSSFSSNITKSSLTVKLIGSLLVTGAVVCPTVAFADAPAVAAKSEEKKEKKAKKGDDDDDDGEIDLECDCLRMMKQGPCGEVFITSAKCYNASKTRPRGQDCEKEFRDMVMCFQKNDAYYKNLEHQERLRLEAAELEELFAEMDAAEAAKKKQQQQQQQQQQ